MVVAVAARSLGCPWGVAAVALGGGGGGGGRGNDTPRPSSAEQGGPTAGGFLCAAGAADSAPADGGAWRREDAPSDPRASGVGVGPVFSRRGGRRVEWERGGGGGEVRGGVC